MPFVMEKPQQNDFGTESVVFPPNTPLEFTLERIEAGLYEPFKPDGSRDQPYPHFRFIYKDAEGDIYQTQPMRFPRAFQFNEKAGFWKHVGALFGRPLAEEDAGAVEIDLGPGFDTWEDVLSRDKMPNLFAKKDEVRPLQVRSIKVHGKELISSDSKVLLMFSTQKKKDKDGKPKRDSSGEEIEYSKLENVLPISSGESGKKKRPV